MTRIFWKDADGRRSVHGDDRLYREDPNWQDVVLFYEYFPGDTGRGVGASHQTGWRDSLAIFCSKAESRSRHRRRNPSSWLLRWWNRRDAYEPF